MSDVSAATELPSSPSQLLEIGLVPFSFGAVQITALWAFGGGQLELFWSRQFILALVLIVASVTIIATTRTWSEWRLNTRSLKAGVIGGVAMALPLVAILLLLPRLGLPGLQGLLELAPPSLFSALFTILLLAPAHAAFSMGLLGPRWGFGGVAFLDALALGFGFQRLWPFLLGYAVVHGFGIWVRQRHGASASMVAATTWTSLILLSLQWLR